MGQGRRLRQLQGHFDRQVRIVISFHDKDRSAADRQSSLRRGHEMGLLDRLCRLCKRVGANALSQESPAMSK